MGAMVVTFLSEAWKRRIGEDGVVGAVLQAIIKKVGLVVLG